MQPLAENSVNIPAFLSKLWKMVNDPETDQLISWSNTGNSFIIQNQALFWYDLLPLYYKHNNMSSFVRQLNMYGFHKASSVENGTMDSDKDEIQFFHPYFQKDQPELLKNIKRKVTGTKVTTTTTATTNENMNVNVIKPEDLVKVLTDVKQLRGKQANVDSQLSAMKQENAVLWRELAMLRQKHIKQQQIVNKLIQFLVTIVQPSTRMSGLGVKRRYPLMLNENPAKKSKGKSSTSEGPTIHELDNADALPDELYLDPEEKVAQVQSPSGTSSSQMKSELLDEVNSIDPISPEIFLNSPDLIEKQVNPVTVDELLSDNDLTDDTVIEQPLPVDIENDETSNDQQVFLNPSSQDTMLSDLISGSYNTDILNAKRKDTNESPSDEANSENGQDMTVAMRENPKLFKRLNSIDGSFREDLLTHVETTQSELDQLLNGCSGIDANALLGLFTDESPPYGLTYNQNKEGSSENDPLVSGLELAPYNSDFLDFQELFDDSTDAQDVIQPEMPVAGGDDVDESINTPQVVKTEPVFPTVSPKAQ